METATKFDSTRYTGQVHAWVIKRGTQYTEVVICRRYTNPANSDDAAWGMWLTIGGDDQDEVATKMLHFADVLKYEVVSEEAIDADEKDGFDDDWPKDDLHLKRRAKNIFLLYRKGADQADEYIRNLGGNNNSGLDALHQVADLMGI